VKLPLVYFWEVEFDREERVLQTSGLDVEEKESRSEIVTGSQHGHRTASSATRENILEVATEEFANKGLSGARVDTIAEKTRTTKRMIYYHFQSKEKLYEAVLEQIYAKFSNSFAPFDIKELSPDEALTQLIGEAFDFDDAHPQFIRVVVNENIQYCKYIKKIAAIKENFKNAMAALDEIVDRGQREGFFRRDANVLDVHLLIRSMCFFRVSNRYTFGEIFNMDFLQDETRANQKRMIVEAVLGYLRYRDDKPT